MTRHFHAALPLALLSLLALGSSTPSALGQQASNLPPEIPRTQTFDEANARARDPRWISLKRAEFDSARGEPEIPSDLTSEDRAVHERSYFLVQLHPPVTETVKDQIRAAGGDVLDYVPNHAFIVRATKAQLAAIASLPAVVWTGDFHPAYRLEDRLDRASLDERYVDRFVTITVVAFEGVSRASVETQILQRGAAILAMHDDTGRWIVDAIATPPVARWLAQAPDLQWIEPADEAGPRNNTAVWTVQTNASGNTKIWNQGLRGEGQIIGHMDGSIALTSCYFADPGGNPIGPNHRKIVYNSGTGVDGHGTHTAGTSVGDAQPVNGSTSNRGHAYLAKIAHTTGFPTTTFSSIATTHANNGARMHTNSWGNDSTTAYNTLCNQIDSFSWNNEDNLVFFASTNTATLKNPENSKNLLAINASGNGGSSNNFCSGGTGPTADGRRKPELYAPGCGIVSAGTGSCSTASMGGTSMACPAATGAGALVRQYFMDGWYPTGAKVPANAFTPTGALVKAMLVNCGQDMTSIAGYPSNQEGWGRILLDDCLFFTGETNKLFVKDVRKSQGFTAVNQTRTYTFNVLSSAVPLKVTLAFHDFPGTVNSSNPVVNDLNLEVTAPGGTLYRGNVLSGGWSTTGGTADAKNNVERVLLASPPVGQYTVVVRAAALPQVNQGFGLAVSGNVSETLPVPQITGFSPNPIPLAQAFAPPVLTIQGSNFTGATSVKIGSVTYSTGQFNVVNDGTITVAFNPPPQEVGQVAVQVTAPSGTSPSALVQINLPTSRVCMLSKNTVASGGTLTIYMAAPNPGNLPLLAVSQCLTPFDIPPYVTYPFGGCGDFQFLSPVPAFSSAGLSTVTVTVPLGATGTFYLAFAEWNPVNPTFPLLVSSLAVLLVN